MGRIYHTWHGFYPGGAFANAYSFDFDGVNNVFNTGTINIDATTGLTLSCWVKSSGMATWDYLCSRGGSGIDSALNFRFAGWGGLYANISQSSQYSGLAGFTDGNWHHILITLNYSTGDVHYYKDNVVSATVHTFASTYSNAILACIGALTTAGTLSISAKIDQFSIIPKVVTSGERAAIYNSGAPADLSSLSPVVWFQMGDGATWDGSNWSEPNLGSAGGTATTLNMGLSSQVADVPT
jgi:hypothetical protein